MNNVTRNATNSGHSAPVTDYLASSAHEAIDGAADKSAPIEKHIRATAVELGEQLETSKAHAADQLDQTLKQMQSFVKDRPIAAAGIAFAAGVVVTTLLRR